MRTRNMSAIMAVAIALVGAYALGQEVVPTPAPTETANVTPHVSPEASATRCHKPGSQPQRPGRQSLALPLVERPLVVLDAAEPLDVV